MVSQGFKSLTQKRENIFFIAHCQRKRHTKRCVFFVGGDGEIARAGEAGAGSVRDRRRGRRKGVHRGRKQGVLEARSRAHLNDYVFGWMKKGEAFRLDIIALFLLRVKISIPLTLAKKSTSFSLGC